MSPVRYIDLVLLALGAAVAIPLGAPALGYAIGAGTWLLQRIVQEADKRWIANVTKPVARLGYTLFEAFGRIWLLAAGIIVAIAVGTRADALTAALIIFCAYTVMFVVRLASGPPAGQSAR
ncbi:MAG: hypothetical protein ABSC56_02150 [Solirubrobacteraceae bacterium]